MSEAGPDENALVNLLKALDSRRDEERAGAIRRVQTLAPAALLTLSRLEAQHFRRLRRMRKIAGYAAVLVIYGPMFVLFWKTRTDPGVFVFGAWMMLCTCFILPYLITLQKGFVPSRARRSMTAALENVDAIHFLPAALTLLQNNTQDIKPAIYTLLKRLLPKLHAGDAQNWTPKQYHKLLALLADPKQEPELRLCILKSLEQIGDARAFATLEALMMSNQTPILVRQAAAECIPFLLERAEEKQQARTLLRAAAGNMQGTDLLRGASGANMQSPEEQLLRPR